jgi:hypothetical protein
MLGCLASDTIALNERQSSVVRIIPLMVYLCAVIWLVVSLDIASWWFADRQLTVAM